MGDGLNEGVVADTAKLMMHRPIERMLRRDLSGRKSEGGPAARGAERLRWTIAASQMGLRALVPSHGLMRRAARHRSSGTIM